MPPNSPTQLATQIRFHLEHLGESNSHHAFEQLCLGLTRRRIVSNVMPATGPVAAGGDNGRDGESYWTALQNELPGSSIFCALATNQRVVLGVTSQRQNIPSKIREDLAKICGEGSQVDRVIYFTITPIPVAKRHELQNLARDDYSIELEIWDAQAISEELVSHDLFFLAVDYLRVPSSLAPERPVDAISLPEWYVEDRQYWRNQTSYLGSAGELVSLREGLRFASQNDDARADLPDWLTTARRLQESSGSNVEVLNRIEYEIALATGIGLNTLRPVDSILRTYFSRITIQPSDTGVLVDAMTLLRLVQAMQPRKQTSISVTESSAWQDALEETVDLMLAHATGPNTRAHLLSVAAMLAHGPEGLTEEELVEVDPSNTPLMSEIHRSVSEAMEEDRPLPSVPADGEVRNLDKGMKFLTELADLLPSTPLVPIEALTALFDITAPLLIDHPEYARVRQALDEATVQRSGKAAAGDRAQARAASLLQAERPIEALREIHAAKTNWLHGESVEGAAKMMLLASRVYEELRLPLAAKQYAMSAALLAKESDNPALGVLIAGGIIRTATYEHQAGQWLTATETFKVGIWAQAQLVNDPWNTDRYPYFHDMLIDQCFILRTAKTLRATFLPLIQSALESTKLNEMIEPMLAAAEHFQPPDELEVAESANRSGMGQPFSDAGTFRHYTWSALGNVWTVRTSNDRLHVLAAERFVAAAQITLADLASEDLLLLNGPVDIEIEVLETVDPNAVFTSKSERNAQAHLIRLTTSKALPVKESQIEVASAVLQTLLTQSLLGKEQFVAIMERTFERGLPQMLTGVRPYDDLADIHDESFFEKLRPLEQTFISPVVPAAPDQATGLTQAFKAPATGYDRNISLATITNRYKQLMPPVRLTVKRLAQDPTFLEVMNELKSQGWKDWHLLIAVTNIVVNYRAVTRGINMTTSITQTDIARFQTLMAEEESETDSEVPVSQFSLESMWFHLGNAAIQSARNWGLEIRNPVEPKAFLSLLAARFNYWSDDVEHEPIFEP